MRTIKIYLAIVTTLLIVAIGVGVYVWYMIQHVPSGAVSEKVSTEIKQVDENTSAQAGTVTPQEESAEPIILKTSTLSETQQKMLTTLGYTQDNITITPAMIACAEDSVGKERLNEIIQGSAPSPLESVQLLPCFKK